MNRRWVFLPTAFTLPLMTLIACSQPQATTRQATPTPTLVVPEITPEITQLQSPLTGDLTSLFSRPWRVTAAPSEPALGSINIFLPNGTMLQTSCVETYMISSWTIDKARPQVLQVSENGQAAYTAEILELTDTTLRLRKTLLPSNETQEVTLTAVEDQFTCPDLSR
jgi:hypothetical protein